MTTQSLPTGWHGSPAAGASPERIGWPTAALPLPTTRIGAIPPVPIAATRVGGGPGAAYAKTEVSRETRAGGAAVAGDGGDPAPAETHPPEEQPQRDKARRAVRDVSRETKATVKSNGSHIADTAGAQADSSEQHLQADEPRQAASDVSRETPVVTEVTDDPADGASSRSAVPTTDAPEAAPTTPGSAAPGAAGRSRSTRERIARPARPRVLTISNQKGGVGKTTTAVNVAAALAQTGQRVLVIDIDPQGNASTALGIPHHAEVPSVYDVIVDDRELADVLQECPDVPGLWCAPATIDLAGAELELVSLVARESRLKRAIDRLQAQPETAFDYILIDCPPSLGLLTVNALVACREVFIPIQCEYYALEGLSQLVKNIELIRAHLNPELHISTILLTMYDARTRLSAQVADEVRAHFPDKVLRASVPRSVRISEAPSHGQTVLSYDPWSSGALSYAQAAREMTERATTIDR